MIAFGTSMTDPEAYRRYARPGIERAAESDSELLAIAAVGSIARGYNLLLDLAARYDELEALVLVNQEVELTDPGACTTIRDTLAAPGVEATGCAGATGVRSIAWWEGQVHAAEVTLEYQEHGPRPDARLRLDRDKPGARGGGDAGRSGAVPLGLGGSTRALR